MTPEEIELLKTHTAEIAKILYKNAPSTATTNLEAIEKHIREQWLDRLGPEIAFFYPASKWNRTRTEPNRKKLFR